MNRIIHVCLLILCLLWSVHLPAVAEKDQLEVQPSLVTNPWQTAIKFLGDVLSPLTGDTKKGRSSTDQGDEPRKIQRTGTNDDLKRDSWQTSPSSPRESIQSPRPEKTKPPATVPQDASKPTKTNPKIESIKRFAQPKAAREPEKRKPSTGQARPRQAIRKAVPWSARVIASGAAAAIIRPHAQRVDNWTIKLDTISKTLAEPGVSDAKLRDIPSEVDEVRVDVRKLSDEQKLKLADARARLEKLGPKPKIGQPPESELIADQRKDIGQKVAAHDALIKHADVILVRAGQLVERANTLRRERFAGRLLKPAPLFHSPVLWSFAFDALLQQDSYFHHRIYSSSTTPLSSNPSSVERWSLFLIPTVVFLFSALALRFVWPLQHPISRSSADLGLAQRSWIVLLRSLRSWLPWLLALTAVYLVAHYAGFVTVNNQQFIVMLVLTVASASFLLNLLHHSANPKDDTVRILSQTQNSTCLLMVVGFLIILWAADQISSEADTILNTSYPLSVLRSTLVAALYFVLLIGLLCVPLDKSLANSRFRGWPVWLYVLIAVTAATVAGSTMAGYVSLARFVGAQVVATGGIIYLAYIVHKASEYLSTRRLNVDDDNDTASARILRATVGILLDIAILFIGIPVLLLQWGFDWAEVFGWIRTAFFGFQIVGVTISLQSILIAIGILIGGVFLTRILQRWFIQRAELTGTLNNGVRDSIRTALGYAGFIASVLLATSSLGVSYSSLAIVAGALSLGIGFGLQSIVNNFVSGLILLVERPIKLGDWIVVGDKEGRVQKISVRSTQIGTFDRSTVIVPNADLITGQVVNRDHGDSVGRLIVNVGVSYTANPEQVIDILDTIGRNHPLVQKTDASPHVVFEAFGESSMNFSLRLLLHDIKYSLDVKTDLHVAIYQAFRDAGIEIPFPQRDLNIRNTDGLSKLGQSHYEPSHPRAGLSDAAE